MTARSLQDVASRAARGQRPGMISALWQVASRQWRTHRLRVAMTTLGIALGVAVFFAVRTANAALLESLTLTVERLAGKSTLEVTAGEAGFPEETLDTVRATPGVQLAEPVIEVIVHTAFQDEGNLMILGVDTTGRPAVAPVRVRPLGTRRSPIR